MSSSQQAVLVGSGRVHSLRAMLFCLAATAVCSIVPFVENAYLYSVVLALGAAVALPAWYDWSRDKLDYFEPIHLVGFLYLIYFGVGSIWLVHDPSAVAYDLYIVPHIPRAVLYCLLGYLALLTGYYGPWVAQSSSPKLAERPTNAAFLLIVGVPGLIGFVALATMTKAFQLGHQWSAGVSSIVQLSPLFLFAWALAWLVYFSGRNVPGLRATLFGIFLPGVIVIGFLTFSDKSLAMTLAGIPVMARWYVKRRMPWVTLLVMLLILIFVVFPLYNTFRWFSPERTQTQRLALTVDMVRSWNSDAYMKYSLGNFKVRMAMINSVAILVRDVGRWVPYARGDTILMPLVSFFIPRLVWPDKPIMDVGKGFGREFRVTNFYTRETHIGATVPGELYWNWGLPGVLIGMGLIGLAIRLLHRRYGASDDGGPVPRAIAIMLLTEYAHLMEGVIAPTVVEVTRTLVLIGILRWFGLHYGLLTRSRS